MIWMIFIKISKKLIKKKNRKILISFDDTISDILDSKKLNPIVTKLFIRGRKSNISIVFITLLSYFAVPKNQTKSYSFFYYEIINKRKIQKIAFNNSADTDFEDFMNIYKKCNTKPYSLLVIDITLMHQIIFQQDFFTKNTETDYDN